MPVETRASSEAPKRPCCTWPEPAALGPPLTPSASMMTRAFQPCGRARPRWTDTRPCCAAPPPPRMKEACAQLAAERIMQGVLQPAAAPWLEGVPTVGRGRDPDRAIRQGHRGLRPGKRALEPPAPTSPALHRVRALRVLPGVEWSLVATTGPSRVDCASCHDIPEVNGFAVSLRGRQGPPAPVTAGPLS